MLDLGARPARSLFTFVAALLCALTTLTFTAAPGHADGGDQRGQVSGLSVSISGTSRPDNTTFLVQSFGSQLNSASVRIWPATSAEPSTWYNFYNSDPTPGVTYTKGGLVAGTTYFARFQATLEDTSTPTTGAIEFTPTDDTTPPNAAWQYYPSGSTNDLSYSVSSNDNDIDYFECRLDYGNVVLTRNTAPALTPGWDSCNSMGSINNLYFLAQDTTYTFQIRPVDLAGNADQTPLSTTFSYDSLAPDTWITSENSSYITTDSITFSFDGQDTAPNEDFRRAPGFTQAGDLDFECRLDGDNGPVFRLSEGPNDWQDCTSATTYDNLADGDHLFEVRAIDGAGNADYSPASWAFTVDRQGNPQPDAPETWITSGPTGTITTGGATYTFTGVRAASFECELLTSGGPTNYVPCESPISYDDLADGSYRFAVRAVSSSGVVDPTPAIADFTVDTSGDQVVACPAGNSAGVVCTVDANHVMTLRGTTGADTIVGTHRGDILRGRGGRDDMTGRGGADVLRGGTGHDTMAGGRGDDRFLARDGQRDRIRGGGGHDSGRFDRDLDVVTGV